MVENRIGISTGPVIICCDRAPLHADGLRVTGSGRRVGDWFEENPAFFWYLKLFHVDRLWMMCMGWAAGCGNFQLCQILLGDKGAGHKRFNGVKSLETSEQSYYSVKTSGHWGGRGGEDGRLGFAGHKYSYMYGTSGQHRVRHKGRAGRKSGRGSIA